MPWETWMEEIGIGTKAFNWEAYEDTDEIVVVGTPRVHTDQVLLEQIAFFFDWDSPLQAGSMSSDTDSGSQTIQEAVSQDTPKTPPLGSPPAGWVLQLEGSLND